MPLTMLDHNAIDFIPLLQTGAIHYVSVAMPGLTVASANVEHAGRFDVRQRNDFMMRINHARETGTLWPRVNITLLPSPSASYLGFESVAYHDGDYPTDDVIAHILDAFKANSEYVKSDTIYLDFRCLCVSDDHYVACLKKAMNRLGRQNLPEVITWQPGTKF